MFDSYEDMMIEHQREMNEFPMCFAFGNEQFLEMMNKWGLNHGESGNPNKDDLSRIISIGCGGYIKAEDEKAFNDMCERHSQERREFLTVKDNLINSVVAEMLNHEYCLDPEDDVICSALGHDASDLENDIFFADCYKKAKSLYYEKIYDF